LKIGIWHLREYKPQVSNFVIESMKALRWTGAHAIKPVQKESVKSKIDCEIVRLQEEVDS
jgi:hypothetical protein